MIRSVLLTALLAQGLAAPASAKDPRLATRHYEPEQIVRINTRMGVQSSIVFGADEHIENIAIGDSTTWQVTPNKRANMLFVKPLDPKAKTNMTVITDRYTYFFDLAVSPGGVPVYQLNFIYPEPPKTEPAAPVPALTAEEDAAISPNAKERPVDLAALNFAWRSKGASSLLPTRVYDDGNATYLTWSAKAAIPAIQIVDETGVEGPVNYAVRDDVIVIDGVPRVIVLRAGKAMATLENAASPLLAPKIPSDTKTGS